MNEGAPTSFSEIVLEKGRYCVMNCFFTRLKESQLNGIFFREMRDFIVDVVLL